ncbi:hypothetical protein FB451DRAFT_777855 [Mycena latifolia]|nr:hypothetical protein FB451DRAFT_777855 [Mycena latifolia]
MERLPYLTKKVLTVEETDANMGKPCPCGAEGATCEVQCPNCTQYAASCKACFIAAHKNNPFHWAEVWDESQGVFRRHNLSALGHPLQLGHDGGSCEYAVGATQFTIAAETGVHALQLLFCGHWGAIDNDEHKVELLLSACLFPCSFDSPRSAITFNALQQFHILHLESKVAAFDYCGVLRCLSDNAFTEEVPDMYENFIRCSHMWGVIATQISAGQVHRIDKLLAHRPLGNTVLYCPSCPEAGFNMDPNQKMCSLPNHLRHLNQERRTIDGNFHCTKSMKNTDPNDLSLYRGSSFFPTDADLKEYLAKVPVTTKTEKSHCNYLKAVNNQDKKKFKNMEISAIVNVQCSHVFIQASVDLQHGERYANVDLTLARAIRQKIREQHEGDVIFKMEFDSIDQLGSYDAACQYSVYVGDRFEEFFPDVAHIVKKMRWAVPALHIQGHQEECMYKFGTCYMLATGHFHGESAEVYWPELNQIGTQVTQMSGGHRHDTISIHHNDWNSKKMSKAFALLLADIITAQERYTKHHDYFLGLCRTYAIRIVSEGWRKASREPDRSDPKYTKSVYRHAKSKVPSQLAIYELMLADEAAVPNTSAPLSKVAAFLNDGILIQRDQLKVKKMVARNAKHYSEVLTVEIEDLRETLQQRIAQWRRTQKALTPAVEDRLITQDGCKVEKELLGLPSDFTVREREQLGLLPFTRGEAELREGAAYDALASVIIVVKAVVSFRDRKKKNDSGVYKNTRAQKQIEDTERRRDLHIANYMAARKALIDMGQAQGDHTDFPPLEVKDTAMKSRTLRRQLGHSGVVDGALWAQGAVSTGARRTPPVASTSRVGGVLPETVDTGTLMSRRKRPLAREDTKTERTRSVAQPKKKLRVDGWLWSFRPGKMNPDELREWTMEGDRIQWYRAEAEMERWREQLEMKLAEWRTTIRSFAAYKNAWTTLAASQDARDIGHIAYAKRKAAMYARRESEGRTTLPSHKMLGPKYGAIVDDALDLVDFVLKNREADQALQDAIFSQYEHLEPEPAASTGDESEEEWESESEDADDDEEEEEGEGEDDEEDEDQSGNDG